jgi:hypothetical protein
MAKNFITGAAKRVTDSTQRVTAIMKDRPESRAITEWWAMGARLSSVDSAPTAGAK